MSRLVDVPSSDASEPGTTHTWHLLDTGELLAALGVDPVGTILCVHGNPTWSYLWRKLANESVEAARSGGAAWRIVAVDQLDMGFSERTGTFRPLARRVRDLGDLTDALSLEGPVITLGHDWGGVVSLGWAVDHPQLLAGIALLNTAVHQPEGTPIPAPLRLALGPGILGRATVATPAFLETTLALAHPPLEAPIKDAYRAPYRTMGRRGGIGGFVADIPVDARHESFAELERISGGIRRLTVPALMLWGPRDPIFSDRYLDDLAERLPQASIHRFEGAGHLIAEDVAYAPIVLDWLTSLQGGRSAGRSSAAGSDSPSIDALRLWHRLDELAQSDQTALVELAPTSGDGPRVVSWARLSKRVNQLAVGLTEFGVRPGDRVSLLVPPGADLTAVLYACLRIGAIAVVADAGLGLRGLTRAVRGARPDIVVGALPGLAASRALGWPGRRISTTRLSAATAAALGVEACLADLARLGENGVVGPEPDRSAVAAVLFTSGSTGPAKGAVYTHAQLEGVRDVLAAQYGIGVGTGLVAGFAPFALLGPALGATTATPDMDVTSPGTLTARAVAAAADAVGAGVVFLSPAAVANVVATSGTLTAADRTALDGITTFLSAGAPVPEPLLAAAAEIMPNASAHTPYGMTEGLLLTDLDLHGIRAAAGDGETGPGGVCVGRPASGARVLISALDGDGRATGEPRDQVGVTGEIVASAPHLLDHYDRLWATDRVSTRGTEAGVRWHRTGDVGHLDAQGRLWVEGRLQHVITTAAGVVTPVGLEQRIERVSGVSRAAVVGVGPAGTQQLVAVVETPVQGRRRAALAPFATAAAVRAAVPVPIAAVLALETLPTDIRHNSKIDRTTLAAWASGVLAGRRMPLP